ncbi:MAG TPA: hypothetical protein VM686_42295, partial [Polyangiaceae bacterium]|nr:hypothetical protein [Polyangiaceae bacterium]
LDHTKRFYFLLRRPSGRALHHRQTNIARRQWPGVRRDLRGILLGNTPSTARLPLIKATQVYSARCVRRKP